MTMFFPERSVISSFYRIHVGGGATTLEAIRLVVNLISKILYSTYTHLEQGPVLETPSITQ